MLNVSKHIRKCLYKELYVKRPCILKFYSFLKFQLQLLQYIGHSSPECLETFDRKLNEPSAPPIFMELETEAIGSVINERNLELDQLKQCQRMDGILGRPATRPSSRASVNASIFEGNSSDSGNFHGTNFHFIFKNNLF